MIVWYLYFSITWQRVEVLIRQSILLESAETVTSHLMSRVCKSWPRLSAICHCRDLLLYSTALLCESHLQSSFSESGRLASESMAFVLTTFDPNESFDINTTSLFLLYLVVGQQWLLHYTQWMGGGGGGICATSSICGWKGGCLTYGKWKRSWSQCMTIKNNFQVIVSRNNLKSDIRWDVSYNIDWGTKKICKKIMMFSRDSHLR